MPPPVILKKSEFHEWGDAAAAADADDDEDVKYCLG